MGSTVKAPTAPTNPTNPVDPSTPVVDTINAFISGGTFIVGDNVNLVGFVTGNSEPVTWTITSGSLPTGLNLATSGVISGTPTQAGSFTAYLVISNSRGSTTASVTFTINAQVPQLVVPPQSGDFFAIKGQPIAARTINVTGGDGILTSEVAIGSLPNGLSLSGLTLSGRVDAAVSVGDYDPIITVKDGSGQSGDTSFNIKVRDVLNLTVGTPPPIYRGINYTFDVSASGGENPVISANFDAIPGFSFSNGHLSGQLSSVTYQNETTGRGSASVTFQVSDDTDQKVSPITRTFDMWDYPSFEISGNTNVRAESDSVNLTMTSKSAPGTLSYIASGLPKGLSINESTGQISGIIAADASGVVNSTVTLKDGPGRTATQNIQFNISPAIQPLTASTISDTTMNVNDKRTITFTMSGGTGGYTRTGSLPTHVLDITFNGNTGSIALNPRSAQPRRQMSFKVRDSSGTTIDVYFNLTVNDNGGF
jgi:hypothetical protein